MSISFSPWDALWLLLIPLALVVWVVIRRRGNDDDESLQAEITRQWAEVEALVDQKNPTAWKLAVLEADKLLDYGLKSLGLPGQTLGERLKVAVYRQPALRAVWEAHAVRNRLAHEPQYTLDQATARRTLKQFAQALKVLRVLKH